MPLIRKRRATQDEPPNNDDSSPAPEGTPNNTNGNRRRRTDNSPDASDASDYNNDSGIQAPDGMDAMVKKMVRLALSCEYSRQPIRRKDISTKVLGEQGTRQFKPVFERAQKELRYRFGMEMRELPAKVVGVGMKASQRQSQPTTSSSNKSWILTTTLPTAYRTPTILPPPRAPSSSTEATYTGLYTFIISLITLCGGTIPEQKLERYLRRVNADAYTPIDRTENLLGRLVKEGYLVKSRDTEGGEEVVEYGVGGRGRVEVGDGGVEGVVRRVYGLGGEVGEGGEGLEREEFEAKLKRSLGLKDMAVRRGGGDAATAAANGGQEGVGRGGRRRQSRRDGDDEDMDYRG
ncbi:Altered inheritance of mitochondria protein 18 mitochondrial [Arachnomyces sp. PD_36]|nr:Altered inheritance of mitochondria protein 18 mitochondrial [Arachnomyces sp. PD_36]